MCIRDRSFDEFKAIYTKVKSGELAFGGLQLAMDAFDTLVAAEPDGSSDSEAEAEPEPAAEEAPARAPSADRAPAADRPAAPAEAKMKPKRKKDIAGATSRRRRRRPRRAAPGCACAPGLAASAGRRCSTAATR